MSVYTKVGPWSNDTTPPVNAANLNHIEDGIYQASLPYHIIDWVVEYGVNATGVGGESTNATAWANLMTDIANGTTRDGIRDILLVRPGDVINMNTTFVGTDLVGIRFWFMSGPTFNESVLSTPALGYFRWTGSGGRYMFQLKNNGTNQRGVQWNGIWNMVTSTDQTGWGLVIDNMNNWGGAAAGLGFGSDGASHSLQRGLTLWSTGDDAHGSLGQVFSANVGQGAIYAEGGGVNVFAGNISHGDNQIGAVISGENQRVVSDMVTNGTTTITSATAAFDANWDPGRPVSGTNIPAGAWIVSVTNSTTAVISSAATGSGSGGSLTLGSAVPGSEVKFYPGVKFDGGTSGAGGAVGILCHGGHLKALGINMEGYNSATRTVSDMVTNGTTTITSATASFTAADAPSGPRPGREVSGTNIPAGARIASVTNSTTAVLTVAASGSGSGGSLTITNRAVGIDVRRVASNSYSARGIVLTGVTYTGHDGSMLPTRWSYAPGSIGNAQSSQNLVPVYESCLAPTGGASDSVFFPGKTVSDFCDTWFDYYLLQRGSLTVVS